MESQLNKQSKFDRKFLKFLFLFNPDDQILRKAFKALLFEWMFVENKCFNLTLISYYDVQMLLKCS